MEFVQITKDMVDQAKVQLQRAQEQQACHANASRRDLEFSVGDQVLLSTHHLASASNKKFRQRYIGPFCITKKVGPVAY